MCEVQRAVLVMSRSTPEGAPQREATQKGGPHKGPTHNTQGPKGTHTEDTQPFSAAALPMLSSSAVVDDLIAHLTRRLGWGVNS